MSPVGAAAGPAGHGTRLRDRAALAEAVRRRLAAEGRDAAPGEVAAALRAEGLVLGGAAVLDLTREIGSELAGAGPLEPLLADAGVTDVLVNGPDEVWVERDDGLHRVQGVRFANAAEVRRLAQRLAGTAGRRLDDAQPWVDARLPDGTRLHAVLSPVAVGCTCVSLRAVRPRAFTPEELVAAGSLPEEGAELLRALVRARLSFLVSGGTGSGKSTLLAALLGLVAPAERIVLVEDSAELRPAHRHVVRLECRPPNQEGAGRVVLADLVRQALRMRPDRLVVGEVRGAEVTELLAALNTGHSGGACTLHANAAQDVPARLEALAAAAGMGREAVHSQVAAALDAVVHVVRGPDGGRRVAEVHALERGAGGLVGTVPAVRMAGAAAPPEYGPGWGRLRGRLAEAGFAGREAAAW